MNSLTRMIFVSYPKFRRSFSAKVWADVETPDGVMRLATPKSDDEFARVLYAALRAADEQGLATVVVQQPVGDGIAIAIRDRLKRAAHGSTQS